MAIDPSIALAYRPPQIATANPLEMMGQVLNLHHLMQQGEMGALQLKQAQVEFQERQNIADLMRRFSAGQAPPVSQGVVPAIASPGPPAPGQYQEPNLMGPAGVASSATPPPGPALPIGATPAPDAAVAPLTAAPGAAAQAASFPSLGELVTASPISGLGLGIFQKFHEAHKAQLENQIKETDLAQKTWEARGAAAQSVLDAPDPKAAFEPAIWDLVNRGALSDTDARQILARGFNADELKRFASTAQDVAKQAETKKTNLMALGEGYNNAAKSISSINDQPGYEKWLPFQHPAVQAMLGGTYSPQIKAMVQGWGIPQADQPKAFREQALSNGMRYAAALQESPQAAADLLASFPKDQQDLFRPAKTPLEAQQRSLNPEQYIQTMRAVSEKAFEQAANLREGFTKASEPFRIQRDAYSRFRAAVDGPPGGIRDIGLIYSYMKLVDPGAIVREGQAATVENASGVPEWVRNLYNRLLTGETLPENTRTQIQGHVEQIYANASKDQAALEKDYTERAQRFQLNPKDVIVPFQSASGTTPQADTKTDTAEKPASPGPALGEFVPAGTVREGRNGQWFMSRGGQRKDTKNWFPVTKNADGSWDMTRQ